MTNESDDGFKRIFPSTPIEGTEIFSSTVISVYEILPRSHRHSSRHEEKIPRFTMLLDLMETERIEDILSHHNGGRLAVIPNPMNSSIVRIEINSAASDYLFRETVLDLYADGRLREIHRLEHSNESQFHKKNEEIASRPFYYVVKRSDTSEE